MSYARRLVSTIAGWPALALGREKIQPAMLETISISADRAPAAGTDIINSTTRSRSTVDDECCSTIVGLSGWRCRWHKHNRLDLRFQSFLRLSGDKLNETKI